MQRLCLRLLTAALAVSMPVVAQRTVTVAGSGAALEQALANASVGDVFLVRPGVYTGQLRADRGIAIVCDPGALVTVGLDVHDLPAGETLRWLGGEVSWLNIRDCRGSVFVERAGLGAATVLNSAHVGFNACSPPTFWGVGASGLMRLTCRDSAVASVDCVWAGFDFATGVDATSSRLTVRGGSIMGGCGSLPLLASVPPIRTTDTTLVVGRGSTGAEAVIIGCGTSAILASGGVVRLDPTARLMSGSAPGVGGTAAVELRPVPSIVSQGVAATRTWDATIHAEIGSTTATLMGPPAAPTGLTEGLWLDRFRAVVVDLGIVGPSGQRSIAARAPRVVVGMAIVAQPVSLSASGAVHLGVPTPLVFG
ncbi:MAG: hypothetical protein AAF628_23700 [Planctomycetota bacterium]